MSEIHELTSAKYFEQAEQARLAAAATTLSTESEQPSVLPTRSWERANSWISLVAGVAVLACVGVLAAPYVNALFSKKTPHPINMMLRFGGASSDQTFEKFLRDSAAANQREWEERYRDSPMYQFNTEQGPWNSGSALLIK